MRKKNLGCLSGLIFSVILLATQSKCDSLDDQEEDEPLVFDNPQKWEANFLIPDFDQIYTLTADLDACTLQLNGSTPSSLTMKRMVAASVGDDKALLVYAGWPANEAGQLTGITNRSNDHSRNCISENKLGPTVAWIVLGCKQVCVHSVILRYIVTADQSGQVSCLTKIEEPFLDESLTEGHCLNPSFQCDVQDSDVSCAGAIDQPGSTISDIGDGYTALSGDRFVISENDRISIEFEHRAFIECDSEIVALTEWGYQLDALVGLPAYLVVPQIEKDVNFNLLLRKSMDPLERAAFHIALKQLDDLHRVSGCE